MNLYSKLILNWPKKVVQVTIIVSLIFFTSLSQFTLQKPRIKAIAFEEHHVHPFMSQEAAKLLPEGSTMRFEIEDNMEQIQEGSTDEDHTDYCYEYLTGNVEGIVSIPHFWDADKSPDDRVKNIFGQDDRFPNAYQKACCLLRKAVDIYPESKGRAYKWLGHVAHLVEDQAVPAHVHEDFHLPILGNDDSFEDWIFETDAYTAWAVGSGAWVASPKAGGLITFPDFIQDEMRQGDWGNWEVGLFYLMYTTNQHADYFASDDVNGDSDEPYGWVDYSGWPVSPTVKCDMSDNDHGDFGDTLDDDDNDRDRDLSTIASYTFVYSIRAVATLYKMFYEATHPPTAGIRILDWDGNGIADYRYVSLELTYDEELSEDLECKYANEGLDWSPWEPVRHIKSWILTDEDGPKTIHYQVRNLMGLLAQDKASITLQKTKIPQVFNYNFSATGINSTSAVLDVYINKIWVRKGELDLYLETLVEDPTIGDEPKDWLTGPSRDRVPTEPNCYFNIDPDEDYGWGDGRFDLSQVQHPEMIGIDYSHIYSLTVRPGQFVRFRTRGRDYNDWLEDDRLGSVWTRTYEIPTEPGIHVLEGDYGVIYGWFHWKRDTCERGTYEENEYYSIQVTLVATVNVVPYSASEGPFGPTGVGYGEPPQPIASSNLKAGDIDTTEWEASIDNTAVRHAMTNHYLFFDPDLPNGRYLWCWLTGEPDMVVGGFSAVDILIIDPDGKMIGTQSNQVPGASVLNLDINGDGDTDTLFVFDERKDGDYQIVVSPIEGADPTDTYSIGISTHWSKYSQWQPIYETPRRVKFLVEDVPLAEIPTMPYVIHSTASGVNLPPRADANGPYRVTEGTIITFNASRSSDPDGASLQYRWDFDSDGTWDTEWAHSATVTHTWQDDWTGIVKVEASDGTFTDSATANVHVSNAAPIVTVGPDQLAATDEEIHFTGNFTDPGVVDTHMIEWNFGDGTNATETLTPTHIFSERKKYTVTLTIKDDDGGIGKSTLIINTGVEVSIDPISAVIPIGGSTTYNVVIHHLGNKKDTYNLELHGLDIKLYSLSKTSVTLDPSQSESVTLTISLPELYLEPWNYGFTIVTTSQTDPTIIDTADAEAIVGLEYVGFISPEEGATVSGTVRIKVDAIDDWGIEKVELKIESPQDGWIDITANYNTTGFNYYYDWDTTEMHEGIHTLTVRVIDTSGAQISNDLHLNVDNYPEVCEFHLDFTMIYVGVILFVSRLKKKRKANFPSDSIQRQHQII